MVENNIKLYRGLFPIKWQKHAKKTRGKIFCTFAPLMLLRGHSKSMYAQIWKFWSSSLLHTFIRFKKTHSCFLCFTYISPFPFSPPPPPPPHPHTHTYIGNLSSPDFIYLYGLRINDSRCQNTSSLLQITIILTFYQKIKREDLFYYETWRHSKR